MVSVRLLCYQAKRAVNFTLVSYGVKFKRSGGRAKRSSDENNLFLVWSKRNYFAMTREL